MKKRLITLALVLGVIASAAGCSSKPKETEAQTQKATEAAAVETEAATEAAAVEEVTEAPAAEEVTEAAAVEEVTEAPETEVATEAPETEAATEAPETETETEEEIAEVVTEEATEAAGTAALPLVGPEADTEEATEEAAAAVTEAAEEETEAAEEETEAAEEETEAAEEVTEAAEESVFEEDTEEEEETEDLTEAFEYETEEDIEYTVALDTVSPFGTVDDFAIEEDDVVVLYNNDVHGGISSDVDYSGSSLSLGYAGMAGVKDDVMKQAAEVTTVDLGDAIQGSVVTSMTDGQVVMDLMDRIGYDILIPGNHEFDYGMDAFLNYAEEADGEFISANFVNTVENEPVFDAYTLEYYDIDGKDLTVGYVGMTTPETFAKSTPTFFQDEEGNYIYSFSAESKQKLYDCVQEAVDAAYEDGADLVIALGHMGDSGVEPGWSSVDVIENTTGISAFLDGHAHNMIPGMLVQNKAGEDVLLSSTGTKLEHIGLLKMNVSDDNTVTISTGLVNEITDEEKTSISYTEMDDAVQKAEEEFAYLFVKVGSVDYDLVINDPETDIRVIRSAETNMGDFLTDAYRNHFGADIGLLNGGSIRANIEAGDINFLDLITLFPWNTLTGVIEVPGQVVLDCLEMGAHLYPEECGGWMQVSGLTYMVDSTIPSSVNINSDGEFVSVDGEYRVKNVMVGDEPLDVDKLYTVAINEYYSKDYGDGMTMFKGCKFLVPAEGEDEIIDHDVLIDYLAEIGDKVPEDYKDPHGLGRIVIITEENKDLLEQAEEAVTEAVEESVTEAVEEAVTEAVTE